MKRLLVGYVFFTSVFSLRAQNPDGYYIGAKGDTIRGVFIDYKEPDQSPSQVAFQPAGASATIFLKPGECVGFSVSGYDTYLSYRGRRLLNATSYQNFQGDTADQYEQVSVFVRQLFNDGRFRLYELKDKHRYNFFVNHGVSPELDELYFKEYIKNDITVGSQVFKRQLSSLFSAILREHPERLTVIDRVSYDAKSLIALFRKMTDEKPTEAVRRKYPPQLFIGAGGASNSLSLLSGINATSDVVASYPSQISVYVEAGVKLFSQRNLGRLFYTIRAGYYQFSHTTVFDDGAGYHTTTTFSSTVVTIPVSVGYTFADGSKFRLSCSAGGAMLFLLNNKENKITLPGPTYYMPAPAKEFAIPFFGEVEIGLFDKLSVFGGYYSPVSISETDEFVAKHASIRYGVRYYIF